MSYPISCASNTLESNVTRLLRERAEIDEELRNHKVALTILFTDVVGSTAYFDRYGDTQGLAMLRRHADMASQVVAEFDGKVIKTIGDSVMAEFPDPVLGVRAAAEIQLRLVRLNDNLPDVERLQLRIGISHGPSFRYDNDIFGESVNLAARVTKLAGPGQILISRGVRDAVVKKVEISCTWLGKMPIQGKSEKQDIFEVLWIDTGTYATVRQNLTAALARGELVAPGLEPAELVQPSGLTTPSYREAKNEARTEPRVSPSVPAGITSRYDILGELGRGGMGVVYKARDHETGEVIALKVLNPGIATDAVVEERFKNELRLARKITHKNVCRIHEFHRAGGTVFISMEFVNGQSLRNFLKLFETMPFRRGLKITSQICAGLKEAHKEGVVHRDLKPENLIIDTDGNVKILDFGIARSIESTGTISGTGAVVGTPAYMSPEQAEGKPVDGRTDIYALGLVLYEMFTGRRAFAGDTAVTLALKQIREVPQPPRELTPAIPAPVEQVILKCLAKDPSQRFQSVEELEAEIDGQVDCLSMETPVPAHAGFVSRLQTMLSGRETGVLWSGRLQSLFRRHRLFVVAGVVAVLLSAIVLLRVGRSPRRTAENANLLPIQPAVTSTQSASGEVRKPSSPSDITLNRTGSEAASGKVQSTRPVPSQSAAAAVEHQDTRHQTGFQPAQREMPAEADDAPAINTPPVPGTTSNEVNRNLGRELGRVVVQTKPQGAKILVDGKATEYHSPVNFDLPVGKYEIVIQQNGFETVKQQVTVLTNQTTQFVADLKPSNKKSRRFLIFHK